jgi:hypothetical protein
VALTLAALLLAGIWTWRAARGTGGVTARGRAGLGNAPPVAAAPAGSEEIGAAERQGLEQILRQHDGRR